MSESQEKKKRAIFSDNSTLIHSFRNYLTSNIKNITCENMNKKANLKYQQVK